MTDLKSDAELRALVGPFVTQLFFLDHGVVRCLAARRLGLETENVAHRGRNDMAKPRMSWTVRTLAVASVLSASACVTFSSARRQREYQERFAPACAQMRADTEHMNETFGHAGTRRSEAAAGTEDNPAMIALKEAIVSHDAEVRDCYEDALWAWSNIEGRIAMQFVIDAEGRIIGAHAISNDMGVPAIGCCIAQAMRSWTLPKPARGGPLVVTFPYVLRYGR
jgi:hypothetical protein